MRSWSLVILFGFAGCLAATNKDVVVDPNQVGAGDDTDEGYVGNPGADTSVEPSPVHVEITDAPFAVELGDTTTRIVGRIWHDTDAVDTLDVRAESDRDGQLDAPVVAADGTFQLAVDTLRRGDHRITFTVRDSSNRTSEVTAKIGVCDYPPVQTFDASPPTSEWRTYGHATWDPNGWMEITGNATSRSGSIYKIDEEIDEGDFRIEFRIATGGGTGTGADGYAVNIVNVDDVEELEAYIDDASNGGCLGYGTRGICGAGDFRRVDAFHIEFDTWWNEQFPDPTQGNHVAITLDGDPANHVLWTSFQLEATPPVWHDIAVQVRGDVVQVEIDGNVVIAEPVPGFQFDGGYIGVSGSTGAYTNFHRFDDLKIYDRCEFPGDTDSN